MSIRILIVDDSALWRQRLRHFMEREHPSWDLFEAGDGYEALKIVENLSPHLIVLDFLMPGMDGLTAAAELRKAAPRTPIVMFTMHLSDALVECARKAGVNVTIAKSDPKGLIDVCRTVLKTERSHLDSVRTFS